MKGILVRVFTYMLCGVMMVTLLACGGDVPAASTATGTSYTVTGLPCGETHEFRVGAYGDGTTYNSRAGLWSPTATTTARAC